MSTLLSVIIPAYNEKENIPLVYREVSSIFKNLPNYSCELLFVDDGSSDGTSEVLKALSHEDAGVKFICFSRNFGKEIATSAGLHHASGKAAIVMDADLQHPPAFILEFISKWEAGAEVVVGLRKKNEKE